MSSDEDGLFITQNSFTSQYYSDISDCENDFDSVLCGEIPDQCESPVCDSRTKELPAEKPTSQYYSDISDGENVFDSLQCGEIPDQCESPVCDSQTKELPAEKPLTNTDSHNNGRFGAPVDEVTLNNLQRRQFADSTVLKINWAVRTFKQWQAERNKSAPHVNNSPILVELESMTNDELNHCISRFLCEARKTDGQDYPPDTLYSFVICIQLYMDTLGKKYRFLVDDCFSQIRNTLDNLMKLKSKSCPAKKRQAEVITLEEEEVLWSKNILGDENPKQLLYTLVYLLGLNFALRGGQEHRDLRRGPSSQLQIGENMHGRYLQYSEEVSKTNNGGLKYRKIEPKRVVAYQHKDPNKCVVRLFDKYCSHCPPDGNTDALYLRPLVNPTSDIWYAKQPLGRHKLASVVQEICQEGGLTGHRTNHSLRASAASRLYQAEVDEQLICEVTGHRSAAVRNYKRTTEGQRKQMCSVIQGKSTSKQETTTLHDEITRQTKDCKNVTVNLNINVS